MVTTPHQVPAYPTSIYANLYEQAEHRADRVFLAERNSDGDWDTLAFGDIW